MVWDAETTNLNVRNRGCSLIHIHRTVRISGIFSEMQSFVRNMKKFATAEFVLMRRDCTIIYTEEVLNSNFLDAFYGKLV